MNSLIVEVNEDKYLIRYKVLKSVVSRKHTTKERKIINRLELHQHSVVVYLYKINCLDETYLDMVTNLTKKNISKDTEQGLLTYLGRGLSKCSDKDKFDTNLGIRVAISNIEKLNLNTKHDINNKILSIKL